MYGIEWDATPEGFEFWCAIFEGCPVAPTSACDEMTMIAPAFFIDFKEFE